MLRCDAQMPEEATWHGRESLRPAQTQGLTCKRESGHEGSHAHAVYAELSEIGKVWDGFVWEAHA